MTNNKNIFILINLNNPNYIIKNIIDPNILYINL